MHTIREKTPSFTGSEGIDREEDDSKAKTVRVHTSAKPNGPLQFNQANSSVK